MINVLKYIKTLENYKNYKPIITVGINNIENYYDYYIENDLLFIVFSTVTDDGKNSYFNLAIVNPDCITGIYCPYGLHADVSAVSASSEKYSTAFTSTMKDIIPKFLEGANSNNFNLPYVKARISVGDEIIRITENTVVNGDLFSIDDSNLSVESIVGQPGNPMTKKYRFFSNFSKIESMYIPFIDIPATPIKDLVNDEILTLVDTLKTNKYGDPKVPGYARQEYFKGDRIFADISDKTKGETTYTRRYFVSKINNNNTVPLSVEAATQNAWLECDKNFTSEISV